MFQQDHTASVVCHTSAVLCHTLLRKHVHGFFPDFYHQIINVLSYRYGFAFFFIFLFVEAVMREVQSNNQNKWPKCKECKTTPFEAGLDAGIIVLDAGIAGLDAGNSGSGRLNGGNGWVPLGNPTFILPSNVFHAISHEPWEALELSYDNARFSLNIHVIFARCCKSLFWYCKIKPRVRLM